MEPMGFWAHSSFRATVGGSGGKTLPLLAGKAAGIYIVSQPLSLSHTRRARERDESVGRIEDGWTTVWLPGEPARSSPIDVREGGRVRLRSHLVRRQGLGRRRPIPRFPLRSGQSLSGALVSLVSSFSLQCWHISLVYALEDLTLSIP